MTTAREIMSSGIEYVDSNTTVLEAAKKLAQDDIGSMPICDGDRLKGMITDRDIVVKVLAAGKDPNTTKVGELEQGEVVTIGADDPVEEISRTMSQHQVRRLPVIDGQRLVGMVAQADLALTGKDAVSGETVENISR